MEPIMNSTTNRSVAVACKLPHGLVVRDFVKVTRSEPTLGGGSRAFEVYEHVGPRYRLKGPAPALARNPITRSTEIVGDYAITEGIPADVFERFVEANKQSAFIVNQLIYGHEDGRRVRSWARDHEKTKTGFEPLDVTPTSRGGQMVVADARIPAIRGHHVVVD
jgi:hypothetical protein